MKKSLVVLLVALVALTLIVGCKKEPEVPEVKTYTVTFDSNGGTGKPEPQIHKAGEKVTKPNDPTKSGFDLVCWTKDGVAFDFDTDTVTEDMTLVAKWDYKTYSVGDTGPAGGKIFYIANEVQTSTYLDAEGKEVTYTWKYLEVTTENLSLTKEDGTSTEEVECFGYYLTPRDEPGYYYSGIVTTENTDGNGTNAEIGQGRYNTTKLINTMGSSAYKDLWGSNGATDSYVAKLCANYRGGGYSDWFLPSLKELKEIYDHKDQIGGTWHTVDASSTGGYIEAYWSSSEVGTENAWTLKFSDGTNWSAGRVSEHKYLRAIRAF